LRAVADSGLTLLVAYQTGLRPAAAVYKDVQLYSVGGRKAVVCIRLQLCQILIDFNKFCTL